MSRVLNIMSVRISERSLVDFRPKGFHKLDIRIKLALLAAVIIINIGFAIPQLSAMLLLIGMFFIILSAPSPGRTVLFFLGPLFATGIIFFGYSVGFGKTPVYNFGELTVYKEGLILGLGVVLRVYCDITWLALTFITTPFPDVIKAMRWYRIPPILVDTLAMMYRYSFLLFEEFTRMYVSASSRGGRKGKKNRIKTLSRIGAQLFIRSYDRSEKIFAAMLSRGLEGDRETLKVQKIEETSNSGPIIIIEKLNDVTFGYNKKINTLDNINLVIKRGESIAVCGPNGSGKTTLLKICAGLLLPQKGGVSLMGDMIDKKTRNNIYPNAGFLFQDSEDQLFCPTVKEDIAFGPLNMNLGPKVVKERVQYAMEIMKITHLFNRPIHDLSSGEKKRVALAGLLAMRTPLMLLDEPTSGLDPTTANELIELLHELNKKHNYTLVVSTHEIDRIPDFAERVIVLNNGKIHKDGNTREVLTDIPALNDVSLEAPIITQYFYEKQGRLKEKNRPLPLNLKEAFEKD